DVNKLLNRAADDHEYGWYPDMRTASDGEGCDTTKSRAATHVSEHITVHMSIDPFNTSETTTSFEVENVRTTTVTLTETMTAQAQTSSAQTSSPIASMATSLITINHTVTMSAI